MKYLFSINTDFEYVLRKPKQQRLCFGSGQSRDTSRKGMNSFMRYYTSDDYPNIGPSFYNILELFNALKTKVQTFILNKLNNYIYLTSVNSHALIVSVKKATVVLPDLPNPSPT